MAVPKRIPQEQLQPSAKRRKRIVQSCALSERSEFAQDSILSEQAVMAACDED